MTYSARAVPPIRKPELPIAEMYAELSHRASLGDGVAAHQLYLGLSYCATAVRNRDVVAALLTELGQHRTKLGQPVADPLTEARKIESDLEYCRGADDDMINEYHDWLRAGAELGDTHSQVAFGRMAPPIPATTPPDDALVRHLREELVHWHRVAAGSGSIDAVERLALDYFKGTGVEADHVTAYGYLLAAAAVREATGRFREDLDGRFLAQLESGLRPVEIEQARNIAYTVLSNPACCTYVDDE